MEKIIIIRIGELYLKGKNRIFFENLLINNIKSKIRGIKCKSYFGRNRYIISDFSDADCELIISKLKKIFGINSLSVGYKTSSDLDEITKLILNIIPSCGKFRVNCNRADKNYPLTSPQIATELGGRVLDNNKSLSVDLHNPDFIINVDIREDAKAYVFSDRIAGAGGMPVGSAGKGLILLSGGIDSPVAGYMMAKRGMGMDALHFHSFPYTSEMAKEKVKQLAAIMEEYCGKINLIFAPFTDIQIAINKYCDKSYLITIMRRCMMRIAEEVAKRRNLNCIINGESLGQVASQTIQSITVTNSVIKDLPVLRPLIGMDKQEILDISEKIGTYKISILPYEDCCTIFLPDKPVTKPTIEHCLKEEAKIPGLDELIAEVINNLEICSVNPV